MIRIFISTFVLFDKFRFISLLVESVKDERLGRPVTGTLGPTPYTDVAFRFRLITSHLSLHATALVLRSDVYWWLAELAYLSALKTACGSLRHGQAKCGASITRSVAARRSKASTCGSRGTAS